MTNERLANHLSPEAILMDAPPNLPDVQTVPEDVLSDVPAIEELI